MRKFRIVAGCLLLGVVFAGALAPVAAAAPTDNMSQHRGTAAECASGWACFYFQQPGGTQLMAIAQDEGWRSISGPVAVTMIVNNQPPGDDACVAEGSGGSGRTFCVDGGNSAFPPPDLTARAFRG